MINLSHRDLVKADFQGKNLKFANLSHSKLVLANFTRADLGGADFRGADLRDAKFLRANLEGAKFDGALLKGANLREAYIRNASFKGAIMTGVVMPDGKTWEQVQAAKSHVGASHVGASHVGAESSALVSAASFVESYLRSNQHPPHILVRNFQALYNKSHHPRLQVDGSLGPLTRSAIRSVLNPSHASPYAAKSRHTSPRYWGG